MHKQLIIMLITALLPAYVYGAAATVTTVDELFNAVAASSTPIHLNTADINLDSKTGGGSDLTINYSCDIDIIYDGNTLIEGNDVRNIILSNGTFNIGNPTGNHRLVFCKGHTENVSILASTARTAVNGYYLDINDCGSGNGLTVQTNPSHDVNVTLTNCRSFENWSDGFSLIGTNTNKCQVMLNLINCEAFSNGIPSINTTGGSANQGVTCHAVGHIVNIFGGSYHDNNDQGVGCSNGSVYIEDANIKNNGIYAAASSALNMDTGAMYVLNCYLEPGTGKQVVAGSTGSLIVLRGCSVIDEVNDGTHLALVGGNLVLEYNYFQGGKLNSYGVYVSGSASSAYIANNIFVNQERILYAGNGSIILRDNIFDSIIDCGVNENAAYGWYRGYAANRNWWFRTTYISYDNGNYRGISYININDNTTDYKISGLDLSPAVLTLQGDSPLRNAGTPAFADSNTNAGPLQNVFFWK